ncbi:hypothetical protein [Desulfogranum mediterraneum]|uniref:hypothetical protein n=1 Tax=Desulfogranum mediterraneum TaxID=160661 RepID=UPI0012947198|nr:hypothetical protein [Desulfogranum mediterraneum]
MNRGFLLGAVFLGSVLLASSAVAEVSVKGDARARYIHRDRYDFGNYDQDGAGYFDSRVRLVFSGTAAGGAYARARVRLIDTRFNGEADPAESKNIWSDYAYIGVPIGPTVVEAGKIKSNISRFLEWDQGVGRLSVDWTMGAYQLIGLLDVEREGQLSEVEIDRLEDNDWLMYGLILKGQLTEQWSGQLNLMYSDDQRDEFGTGSYVADKTGFVGSLLVRGELGDAALETELAYRAARMLNSRDESGPVFAQLSSDSDGGWGWYGQLAYSMDSFTPSLNIGLVTNGFAADNDFGWIMTGNGNNEPIAVFDRLGDGGDWYWFAPSLAYSISERWKLVGNFVWVTVNGSDHAPLDDKRLASLMELSGSMEYQISAGTVFTWKAGYLQPDFDGRLDGAGVEDDPAFGTYGRLEVRF